MREQADPPPPFFWSSVKHRPAQIVLICYLLLLFRNFTL